MFNQIEVNQMLRYSESRFGEYIIYLHAFTGMDESYA